MTAPGTVVGRAAAGCAGAGLVLGIVWAVLAPRVPLQVVGDTAVPDEYQPGGFIAADGIFAVLAVVAGVGLAVTVLRWERRPLVALAAVVVGGTVGGLVMWWAGTRWGASDTAALVAAAPDGAVIDAPLLLRMPGAVLLWPAAGAAVLTSVATIEWWLARRRDEVAEPAPLSG